MGLLEDGELEHFVMNDDETVTQMYDSVRPGVAGLLIDIECSRVRDSSWMQLTSLVTTRIGVELAAVQRKLPDYVVVGFQHNQHLRQYKKPHMT